MNEQTETVTRQFTYNTGRKYSRDGQPISVLVNSDGRAAFTDHARMITGITNGIVIHKGEQRPSEYKIAQRVQSLYDDGHYTAVWDDALDIRDSVRTDVKWARRRI